jgi:polysaccharide biosynthesis transport protein
VDSVGVGSGRSLGVGPPGEGDDGRRERTLGAWTRLVLRRWPVLLAFLLAGLALGAGYSLSQPTLFAARSTLVLSPQSGVLDPANSQDLPALADTIAGLTVTDSVLLDARQRFVQAAATSEERARREGLDLDWMKAHVTASVIANTSLVEIAGQDRDSGSAADLTAATSGSVTAKVEGLGSGLSSEAGLTLTSLGDPTGQGQVSPDLARNLILGGNLGLVLGILAAALMSDRGLRVRGRAELAEALGVSRLVSMPAPHSARGAGLLGLGDLTVKPDDPQQESYRLIRNLIVSAAGKGTSRIAVLGPVSPSVLRSTAAALGAHLCASGARAIVVEADFHGTGWVVDGGDGGLGDILSGEQGVDHVRMLPVPIRRFDSDDVVLAPVGLGVLPAGATPPDPAAALVSRQATELLERLAMEYHHVIVVGPSSQWQAESMAVSERTDATVLVLGETLSVDQARAIRESHEAEPGRLLAVAVLEVRRN